MQVLWFILLLIDPSIAVSDQLTVYSLQLLTEWSRGQTLLGLVL